MAQGMAESQSLFTMSDIFIFPLYYHVIPVEAGIQYDFEFPTLIENASGFPLSWNDSYSFMLRLRN